jgi:regulator of cell morphogenesis and NO signaling
MDITAHSLVADVAAARPATVKVFQQYGIDFCCGGRLPLGDACARHRVDPEAVLADLRMALAAPAPAIDWRVAPIANLIVHIQTRFHEPLRDELPRLAAMMAKVVSRHGATQSDVLLPLSATLESLSRELLDHMAKEDATLFPAILTAERRGTAAAGTWLSHPIRAMMAEHDDAGRALASMRALTRGYTPPEDACPTYRGLYYGLAELERDMHEHVHLENHILFPRATALGAVPGARRENADGA